MKNKKIIVIAPSPYGFYANSVIELLKMKEYEVVGVVLKKFTVARFISEFRRDGKRLISKIWKKLILREKAYSNTSPNLYDIIQFRRDKNLSVQNVFEFQKSGTKILKTNNLNSIEVEQFLNSLEPAVIAFTGGGLIRENIIKKAGFGILNCHMGVLPKYRGMDVVEWPLLNNEPQSVGITAHFMDKGLDTGPILQIEKVSLQNLNSVLELRKRFEPIMVDTMVNTVIDVIEQKITPKPQEEIDGKQFFVMHPSLIKKAQENLLSYQVN